MAYIKNPKAARILTELHEKQVYEFKSFKIVQHFYFFFFMSK